MIDHNLERYSDKVWQGGRKFGREQAIGDVLEIIELNKFCKHNDNEQAKELNKWLNELTSDIKALKGGDQE